MLVVLTGLQLNNIALIDSLELDFCGGFTVLTGETGAGKSILLDALDAVLGGAQGANGLRLLRSGCDRAQIEASFNPSEHVRRWLLDADFDCEEEEELLLSREWKRQDETRFSSRSRLNGISVNRQQLLELRPLLIDLTVQGQTQQLSRPGQQRRWLDQLGGAALAERLESTRTTWHQWKAAAIALNTAEQERERFEQERLEQEDLLDLLEKADLDDPAEDGLLEQEQDRLVHGVRLQEGLGLLFGRLRDGAEQAPSLQEHFAVAIQELQAMSQLDGSVQPLRDQALDLEAGINDLLQSLDDYSCTLDSNPERLGSIQERLADLKRLQRRHGLDLAALIERRDH